jgi:osmotically-inducible protein OsmY
MGETQRVAAEDYVPEVREPAGFRRCDSDIAAELRQRLVDDVGFDAGGVEVEVKDGEVTLRGVVRNGGDMQRAEAHACAIPGVTVVRNELQPKEPLRESEMKQPAGAASKMGKPGYEL